ncbi:MAG: class I SAM-dependent methyltransferase [Bacilli bacterium]|nr:class I SAM-dependent methyltransferase [Bacilli bacterium]
MVSKRIKILASLIPPARSLADIGCDHGYLLIEAFEKQQLDYAVAIDNKEKPLQKAVDNLSKYPFFPKIRFSLSNGLEELKENVEAIVIAGMGGMLIIEILKKGLKDHEQAKFILQANRNHYQLRKYLFEAMMKITAEKIIYEDGQYYEIIVCEHAQEQFRYTEEDLIFGPILRKEQPVLFLQKLETELKKYEELNHQSLNKKINQIKELLNENQ